MDHATCVVQPGRVNLGIVDSAHHGSLIGVVATSGFLGIRFTTLALNTTLPPYVIKSHYLTMVDNNRDRSHIAVRPVYVSGNIVIPAFS
jgi:hypothetical protein